MFQYRSKSFENKKTQTSINYSFPPSDFTLPDSNLRINEHLTKRPKIKSFQLLPFPLFTINELTTALTTPSPSLRPIFHTNSLEQLRANLLAIKSLHRLWGQSWEGGREEKEDSG